MIAAQPSAEAGGSTGDLGPALASLADVLEAFSLDLPGFGSAERVRSEAVRDIREHLLPRLHDREAPLVVACFGATGTGKSVIVNSLAQAKVGTPGAIRPSTSTTVVWAHRDHGARYWREFMRQVRERAGSTVETILGDDPVTRMLTLVDTPPFDHVADDGRVVARDVLAITDLCVFVSSALRYADADAWTFMRLVQRRGVPMLFVLNRLPASPPDRQALVEDYASKLAAAGLLLDADPALIFAVREQQVDLQHGGVPATAVAPLRRELEELTDLTLRRRLARQATQGAVVDLADRVRPLAGAVATAEARARGLAAAIEDPYRRAGEALLERLERGPLPADRATLAHLVTNLAGTAAQEAAAGWERSDAGVALLERSGGALWRHGSGTHDDAEAAVARWAGTVEQAVGERAPRRMRARRRRRVAQAVSTAALGGSSPVPETVERAFGSADGRQLVAWATDALASELAAVLSRDAGRFLAALGGTERLAEAASALTTAAERVAAAAKALE